MAGPNPQANYVMPYGIPDPGWGVTAGNSNSPACPSFPSPWTSNTAGFYYVKSGGSNVNEGFPSSPRATIPNPIPAGAVVVMDTTANYTTTHNGLRSNGTSGSPSFIVSYNGPTTKFTATADWEVIGSYLVIEYGKWNTASLRFKCTVDGYAVDSDHIAARHCEVAGDGSNVSYSLVIGSETAPGSPGSTPLVTNIIIYDTYIHDGGQVGLGADRGGVQVLARTSNIFVLDCISERADRDGFTVIQQSGIGHPKDGAKNLYFGRCRSNDNTQGGFWFKESQDGIVSQCVAYGHRPNFGGTGHGGGGQYAPDRIKWLFNHFYNNERGIETPDPGDDWLVLGNLFTNTNHTVVSYDPDNIASDSDTGNGVYSRGGGSRFSVIGNTFDDCDQGVTLTVKTDVVIENNIFANRPESASYEIYTNSLSGTHSVKNNLCYVPAASSRIRWNGGAQTTMATFQTNNPTIASGNIDNSDPVFTTPGSVFTLQSSSPAKDAGIESSEYADYQTSYGVSITKDHEGVSRPQNSLWDIGAFEFQVATTTGGGRARSRARM